MVEQGAVIELPVARQEPAAVGAHVPRRDRHPRALAHEPELHREPEEPRQPLHVAGKHPDPLRLVPDLARPPGGPLRELPEAHQRVGEGAVGVHRDMAGDVVEDVRLGEVVERVAVPHGDGGRELPPLEAVEEQVRRHVAAHRLGAEPGARLQEAVDLVAARHPVRVEPQRLHPLEEAGVGVPLPAGRASSRLQVWWFSSL